MGVYDDDDDGLLERIDRREMTQVVGSVMRSAVRTEIRYIVGNGGERSGGGCRRHATTDECMGEAVLRVMAKAGYAVMPTHVFDTANAAISAAKDEGRIVVAVPAPTMYDLIRRPEVN